MVRGWNDQNCNCAYPPLCGGGASDCDLVVGEERLMWQKAEEWCIENTGCHLTIIQTEDENVQAEEKCHDCWIGAHRIGREYGDFTWMDGSTFAYSDWLPGEPNNEYGSDREDSEECVHIFDPNMDTWKPCGAVSEQKVPQYEPTSAPFISDINYIVRSPPTPTSNTIPLTIYLAFCVSWIPSLL